MRRSAGRLRAELVEDLRRRGTISSDAIACAFATVPRELFVPDVVRSQGIEAVYRDEALVTKRHPNGMPLSSSSQPGLMATMLELLDVQPGQRVLEVGAGTGYNAALLAVLVGPAGRVTTVDVDGQLARRARRALRDGGYRVSVTVGDGREGVAANAPYDRIIVTAAADRVPRAWLEQLTDGGRLVLPLRLDTDRAAIQVIPLFTRSGDRLRSDALTWGGFMPLHGGDGGWSAPPASLSASRLSPNRSGPLASISGSAISRLSETAASTLLASLLTERRGPVAEGRIEMTAAQPPLLLIYLLSKIPDGRRIAATLDGRFGVGVLARASGSLAVVSVPNPWQKAAGRRRGRVRWRLDAYSGEEAADELATLVAQWQALQEVGRDQLRITAYGHGRALSLRFGWRAGPAARMV